MCNTCIKNDDAKDKEITTMVQSLIDRIKADDKRERVLVDQVFVLDKIVVDMSSIDKDLEKLLLVI